MKTYPVLQEYLNKTALNTSAEPARTIGRYRLYPALCSGRQLGITGEKRRLSPFDTLFEEVLYSGLFEDDLPYFVARASDGLIYFFNEQFKPISPGFCQIRLGIDYSTGRRLTRDLKFFIAQKTDGLFYLYDFEFSEISRGFRKIEESEALFSGLTCYFAAEDSDGLFYLFDLKGNKVCRGFKHIVSGLQYGSSGYSIMTETDGTESLYDIKGRRINGGFSDIMLNRKISGKSLIYCAREKGGLFFYFRGKKKIHHRGFHSIEANGILSGTSGYAADKIPDGTMVLYDRQGRIVLEKVKHVFSLGLIEGKSAYIAATDLNGKECVYDRKGRLLAEDVVLVDSMGFIYGVSLFFKVRKPDGLFAICDRKGREVSGSFESICEFGLLSGVSGFYAVSENGDRYLYDSSHRRILGPCLEIHYQEWPGMNPHAAVAKMQDGLYYLFDDKGRQLSGGFKHIEYDMGWFKRDSLYIVATAFDEKMYLFDRTLSAKLSEGFKQIDTNNFISGKKLNFYEAKLSADSELQDAALYRKDGRRVTPFYRKITHYEGRRNQLYYYSALNENGETVFYDGRNRFISGIKQKNMEVTVASSGKASNLLIVKRDTPFNLRDVYHISAKNFMPSELKFLNGDWNVVWYGDTKFYAARKADGMVYLYDFDGRELLKCRGLYSKNHRYFILSHSLDFCRISKRGKVKKALRSDSPVLFGLTELI